MKPIHNLHLTNKPKNHSSKTKPSQLMVESS
jgi:hypothetical protein